MPSAYLQWRFPSSELWPMGLLFSEKFQVLEVKFSIYLNRGVFVMQSLAEFWLQQDSNRVIIKAGSKSRESGPKVRSKFGQSNNNTKLAPIGMKF